MTRNLKTKFNVHIGCNLTFEDNATKTLFLAKYNNKPIDWDIPNYVANRKINCSDISDTIIYMDAYSFDYIQERERVVVGYDPKNPVKFDPNTVEIELLSIFKGAVFIEFFYKVEEGQLPFDFEGEPSVYTHPSNSNSKNIKHTII